MEAAFLRRAQQLAQIDLASLLAQVSAAQAMTPTAIAQMRLAMPRPAVDAAPRVALFAGTLPSSAQPSGSATFAQIAFSPRQPS